MNTLAIIQARMGSSRLNGKVLFDLSGKTVIEHVVNRVRKSKLIDIPEVNWVYDHKDNQILIYSRGDLLFVFNFSPVHSFADYGIPMSPSKYKVVLNTDEYQFGGQNRIDNSIVYSTSPESGKTSQHYLRLYMPARTAIVLERQNLKKIR